jgi:AcrR family transcriptional regulator
MGVKDSTDPRSRNPRGRGSNLRAEIIAAAIELIDVSGDPAALTLRGIARQAGISAPSIYSHFNDLSELIEAVLAESFEELRQQVSTALNSQPNSANGLIAAGAAYVEFGWKHLARYRLMFAASGYSPDAVATFQLVENAIAGCVSAGTSESSDPHLDAFLLWVSMHGMATLEKPASTDLLRLGPLDRPEALRAMIFRLARLRG